MKDVEDDNLDKYSFSIDHEHDDNSVRTSTEMYGNTSKNKAKKLKSGINIDTISINPLLLKEHTLVSRNFMEQYEEVKKQQEEELHEIMFGKTMNSKGGEISPTKKAAAKKRAANFYEALESSHDDTHLFEIITLEINRLFQLEMEKFKGVTSEYLAMLKRKNLLEARLFKCRFEKMRRHLIGMPSLEATLNPFKKQHNPSIFSENQYDDKIKIPQNREMFENVIKEAFSDMLISIDEIHTPQKNIQDQLYQKIRDRYIERVRAAGPSQVTLDMKEKKFIDLMMELCDEGEFGSIRRKIQEAVKKFTKKVEQFRSKYADSNMANQTSVNINSQEISINGG